MPLSRHQGSSPSASSSQVPPDRTRGTFGVDLADQMYRDDVDVPPIVVKCCEAIEKYGIDSQGIYRIGGTMSKVNKLKDRLNHGKLCMSCDVCDISRGSGADATLFLLRFYSIVSQIWKP